MKRFDFSVTYLLCYTGYKERQARVVKELDRVGISEYDTMWSFPTPYDEWEMKNIRHIVFFDTHKGCWNVTKNHYRAIKTAYELGKESVLILEDDIRFRNDLSFVDESIEKLPDDWDVVMFDHFKMRGDVVEVNDRWAKCGASASTACYGLNRKAMERMILMYESPVNGKYERPVMRNCDHWTDVKYLGRDINLYCAVPNVAIQQTVEGESNCGRLHAESKYDVIVPDWRTEFSKW